MTEIHFNKFYVEAIVLLLLRMLSVQAEQPDFNGDAFLEVVMHLVNDILGVQQFQEYVDQQEYVISPMDGSALINDLGGALHLKFVRRMEAVKDLAKAITDTYEQHSRALFGTSIFPTCCSTSVGGTEDNRYGKKINLETPCVLRQGRAEDTGVLNEAVANVMKENQESIPSLKWQYYGAHDGHLTLYPGYQNCDNYFDPRYRPWYVVAATPDPKDVVIVIDTSGSMSHVSGDKPLIDTASEAADTVICFLNPNDRVAVVSFSSTAQTYFDPSEGKTCYKTELAVATHHNKEALRGYLGSLHPDGDTEYGLGLEKAFDFFTNSENPDTSETKRDRVILFFTDGAPTDAGEPNSILQIIRKRNAELNNTVVILTYGIGEFTEETTTLLTNMAHQTQHDPKFGEVTKGEFRLVSDPKELKREMGSFYNFFSRDSGKSVVFTVPYNDSFGLGLMTSACLPVHYQRRLQGVTCVDISISDLLSEVTYFRHGDLSYAFLIDRKGKVLMHPLMPNPYFVNNDPVYLKMTALETASGFDDVIDDMMNGIAGNKTLNSIRVISRGDVDKEGVKSYLVMSQYIWCPIKDTNFTVCVVIAAHDKDKLLTWKSNYPDDFVYHHDFRNLNTCRHFGRSVVPDRSSVKFTPEAFKNPFEYIEGVDDVRLMDDYKSIMTGQKNDTARFKDSVRNNVALSAKLNQFWQLSDEFVIWLYYGSVDGIFRSFPAAPQPHGYDHKLRPWYHRTVGQKGLYTLSIPYMDAFGTGLIVTLGHVIYEGKKTGDHATTDPVIGVLAMDLSLTYLYNTFLERFPQCDSGANECFIVDTSGFIIIHQSFFKRDTVYHPTQNVHITIKEKYIAQDLLSRNVMQKDICTDLGEFLDRHTYVINLKSIYKGKLVTDQYEIHEVRKSNVFLVKKTGTASSNTCQCHYQLGMSGTRKCYDRQCECPCYKPMIYNHCREDIIRSADDPVPCTPSLPKFIKFGDVESADPSLPMCQRLNCSSLKSKENCTVPPDCVWCSTDSDGNQIKSAFCKDESACSPVTNATTDIMMTRALWMSTGFIAGTSVAAGGCIALAIAAVLIVMKFRSKKQDNPAERATSVIHEDEGEENEAFDGERSENRTYEHFNPNANVNRSLGPQRNHLRPVVRRDSEPPQYREETSQIVNIMPALPPPPYSEEQPCDRLPEPVAASGIVPAVPSNDDETQLKETVYV